MRREHDAYMTPIKLAVEMCAQFEKINGKQPLSVLEPSAGNGVFLLAAGAVGWDKSHWTCFEIRDEPHPVVPGIMTDWSNKIDFLEVHPSPVVGAKFNICIGNPPYKLAKQFVEKALKHADNVMFLLRLGFLASKKRSDLFTYHKPSNVWVLQTRPRFTDVGVDNSEYCIVHWGPSRGDTKLHWIGGSWK
jgi:predicted RNA methylase